MTKDMPGEIQAAIDARIQQALDETPPLPKDVLVRMAAKLSGR